MSPSGSQAELEVLFADNHVLAVAKPAGLPSVPDDSGDESLFDRAKAWVKREKAKPGAVYIGVVHRLDRPVSGVLVFARTSKAAARLTEAFRSRTVAKTYRGVGAGAPYLRSPSKGQPSEAAATRSWCARPVSGTSSSSTRRSRPAPLRASTRQRVRAS